MRRFVLAVLLLCSSQLWAAGAFVQCVSGSSNATTTVTATLAATTAGNLILVATREGTDSTPTWTMTDSGSQSYTQTASGYTQSGGNNARQDVRYKANTASGITTVTATFSASTNTNSILACEISGLATTSVEDTSVNSGSNSFTTSITSGTYTTSNANDMLIYMVGTDSGVSAFTAGSTYAIPSNGTDTARLAFQFKNVTSTQSSQTTSMTWTSNAKSASVFVALKTPNLNVQYKMPLLIQ